MQQQHLNQIEKLNKEVVLSSIEINMNNVDFNTRSNGVYVNEKKTVQMTHNLSKGESISELNEDHFYRAKISNGDFTYTGITSHNLERNGLGLNEYKNGDKYLGGWIKNEKGHEGIILHNPVDEHSEFYIGDWKDGLKNLGVYVWKKHNLPDDKSNLDAYIGKFTNGQISEGLYVSRVTKDESTKEFFYFGKFDQNGKKFDENALYYIKGSNTIFKGKINDNELLSGYVNTINDGKVYYFEREDGRIFTNHEIGQAKKDEIEVSFQDLLKVVNGKDVFTSSLDLIKKADDQFLKVNKLESVNTENFTEIQGNLKEYLNVTKLVSHLFKVVEDASIKEVQVEEDKLKISESAHKLKEDEVVQDEKNAKEEESQKHKKEKEVNEEIQAKEDKEQNSNLMDSPKKSNNSAKKSRQQRKRSSLKF